MEMRSLRAGVNRPDSNTVSVWGVWGRGMLPLVGIALVLAMSFAAPAWAVDAVTGSAEKDGALYTFEVADGEATITRIEMAADNAGGSYRAIIPESVGIDQAGRGYIPATSDANGVDTFLVTAIGEGAAGGSVSSDSASGVTLGYNDEITEIVIPGMVTTIGDSAFAGCRMATKVTFAADTVPDNDSHASHVERIGSCAFAGCSSVSEWDLPDSLYEVGWRAFFFGGCESATRIRLPAAPTAWNGDSDQVFGPMPACEQVEVPEGCVNLPSLRIGSVSEIRLPSTLRGDVKIIAAYGVTALANVDIAEGCSINELSVVYGDIEKVAVPEGVTSLYLQGNFDTLELPGTLETITQVVSPNLESVSIPPKVKTIGADAFARCGSSLKSVSFSPFGRLRTIGVRAFSGCSLLESLMLPESLVSINAYAFQGCGSLTEVELPASLSLALVPFKNCENLRKVSFRSGSRISELTPIVESCPNLIEVSLPDAVVSLQPIYDYVLHDCPSLRKVYTKTPAAWIGENWFTDCGSDYVIYGWGTDGDVLNSCEELGFAFVPYAELDANGYGGASNVEVVVEGADAVRATCRFSTSLSYDYERELVEGEDYALEKVERDGLAYLRLTGNGETCFGEVEVPALQDIAGASVAAIGRQVISDGRAARPLPRIELGGRVLTRGVDYALEYSGNDRAGTATVTATGIGNYTGSVSATFEVAERHEISAAGASADARTSAALAAATLPGMPETCETVVVAWAHDYAAVAVASALAVTEDAQLLVVSNASGLTPAQKATVSGWGATRALVVGGAVASGSGAVGDLEAAGLTCEEVGASAGGAAALSVAAASAGSGSWGSTAVVASPADPAMCLAAAAYAGAVRGPLLFTEDDGMLSAGAASVLAGFIDVVIVGDAVSVDDSIERYLSDNVESFRAAGSTASEVSVNLVNHGRNADVYSASNVTYTVSKSGASANMAYAVNAGRKRASLVIE